MADRIENTIQTGVWGETIACKFLSVQDYEILERNVYTEYGVIDIVPSKAGRIHMVEVKTKRTKTFGHPEEAITEKKLRHLIESAAFYLQENPSLGQDYQIDVIAIQIHPDGKKSEIIHFENAI
jgi:putative endonuclease